MSRDISREGIEALLREDKHIIGIHKYKHDGFPDIDTSLQRSEQKAQRVIRNLQDYIDALCIEDDFGTDHAARRRWRDEIGENKMVRSTLKNDPLRVNNFQSIYYYVEELLRGYKGPNKGRFQHLSQYMGEDFPDNYGELPFQEKIKVVNRTKKRVYEILRFLSAQSPVSSN